MRVSEILNEIEVLELSEKLLLVEGIWDSIARSNAVLPMYEWQKNELDKRYDNYQSGKYTLNNWDKVFAPTLPLIE